MFRDRNPVVHHRTIEHSDELITPEKMYGTFMRSHDINVDQLESILQDYLTVFETKVQVVDYGYGYQTNQEDLIERATRQMADELVKKFLETSYLKFDIVNHIDDPTTKIVSCKMDIFDINKYNKVFRPERCI